MIYVENIVSNISAHIKCCKNVPTDTCKNATLDENYLTNLKSKMKSNNCSLKIFKLWEGQKVFNSGEIEHGPIVLKFEPVNS